MQINLFCQHSMADKTTLRFKTLCITSFFLFVILSTCLSLKFFYILTIQNKFVNRFRILCKSVVFKCKSVNNIAVYIDFIELLDKRFAEEWISTHRNVFRTAVCPVWDSRLMRTENSILTLKRLLARRIMTARVSKE